MNRLEIRRGEAASRGIKRRVSTRRGLAPQDAALAPQPCRRRTRSRGETGFVVGAVGSAAVRYEAWEGSARSSVPGAGPAIWKYSATTRRISCGRLLTSNLR